MGIRVGQTVRITGLWTKAGVAADPGAVVVDYMDESGNASTNVATAAGAIAGSRYFNLAPDAAGFWCGFMKSPDATFTDRDLPFGLWVEESWSDFLSGIATAVMTALLNLAKGVPVAGTWLEWIAQKLGIIGTGTVTTVYPVSTDGKILTLVRGDSYLIADGDAPAWTGCPGPDLTVAPLPTLVMTVRHRPTDEVILTATPAATGAHAVQAELTALLTAATKVGPVKFDVQASWAAGRTKTLAFGTGEVHEDQTR